MSDPDNPDRSKNIYDEAASGLDYLHRNICIEYALYYVLNEFLAIDKVDTSNSNICCIPDIKMLSGKKDDFIYNEGRSVASANLFAGAALK